MVDQFLNQVIDEAIGAAGAAGGGQEVPPIGEPEPGQQQQEPDHDHQHNDDNRQVGLMTATLARLLPLWRIFGGGAAEPPLPGVFEGVLVEAVDYFVPAWGGVRVVAQRAEAAADAVVTKVLLPLRGIPLVGGQVYRLAHTAIRSSVILARRHPRTALALTAAVVVGGIVIPYFFQVSQKNPPPSPPFPHPQEFVG